MVQFYEIILIRSLFIRKISVKQKLAEEKTANKNFCWDGPILGNYSYSQSFYKQNLSKVKVR
jgi:hypothetical protein